MANTTARLKRDGKQYEVLVDLEKALKYKKGDSVTVDFLETETIFHDLKKGERASESDMEKVFGTTDSYEIAGKIVKSGDIELTQDYRDEERDRKYKQVIDFLVRNAVDPKTGNPHTPERLKNALEQAHVNIKNNPIDQQIGDILEELSKVIPIKVQKKKIKVIIPSSHTGRAYGVIAPYKEEENWLSNGDLEVVLSIPAGIVMDFYDKLNSMTHGSAISEEIKND